MFRILQIQQMEGSAEYYCTTDCTLKRLNQIIKCAELCNAEIYASDNEGTFSGKEMRTAEEMLAECKENKVVIFDLLNKADHRTISTTISTQIRVY